MLHPPQAGTVEPWPRPLSVLASPAGRVLKILGMLWALMVDGNGRMRILGSGERMVDPGMLFFPRSV
jgi:hypothetical protein